MASSSSGSQLLHYQADFSPVVNLIKDALFTHLYIKDEITDYRDDIVDCGNPPLQILPFRPDDCMTLAYEKLYAYPYKEVPTCWLRLYTEASLWKVLGLLEEHQEQQRLAVEAAFQLRRERLASPASSTSSSGDSDRTALNAPDSPAQLPNLPSSAFKRTRDHLSDDGLEQPHIDPESHDKETEHGRVVTEIVRLLDMALIMTAGLGREALIAKIFTALDQVIYPPGVSDPPHKRPRHRLAIHSHPQKEKYPRDYAFPEQFPREMMRWPPLLFHIPRERAMSMEDFQEYLNSSNGLPKPFIMRDLLKEWPALGKRPWSEPSYLLWRTLGGRRLVPVEVGRSYTDKGWGQNIITFREFMAKYMFTNPAARERREESDTESEVSTTDSEKTTTQHERTSTGYLAQHELFTQIPSLRADIHMPDLCWTTPPPPPPTSHVSSTPIKQLDEPILNAWFGPSGTISPLHTDPYHNILCQVVGYKYVRLYPPSQTPKLYPRGINENGIDMQNTSQVDVGKAIFLYADSALRPHLTSLGLDGAGDDVKMGEGDEKGGEEEDRREEEGEGGRDETLSSSSEISLSSGSIENWAANDPNEAKIRDFEARFPLFGEAEFVEGILGPGECVYIPVGWWHYVHSLSPSFSVSFWWN